MRCRAPKGSVAWRCSASGQSSRRWETAIKRPDGTIAVEPQIQSARLGERLDHLHALLGQFGNVHELHVDLIGPSVQPGEGQ